MTPSFAISSALRDPDQLGSPVYEELVGEEIYWTIDIPSKLIDKVICGEGLSIITIPCLCNIL